MRCIVTRTNSTKRTVMRTILTALLLTSLLFAGCEISVNKGSGPGSGGAKIRNDISVQAKEVKLEQAFLMREDGSLLPEDNKVRVNEKIRLRLIAEGWSEKDGKIFLDASEKVETNEGNVFLDQKDLFRDYSDGLSAEDAKYITLSVVITQIDKLYDYYKVSFSVKDKNDENRSIQGSYKLYIQ